MRPQTPTNTLLACSQIDILRKPLKAMVLLGGAYSRTWANALGRLSNNTLAPAHWQPELAYTDTFWGSAAQYTSQFTSEYKQDYPSQYAASKRRI